LSASEKDPPERSEPEPAVSTSSGAPRRVRWKPWIDAVYVLALGGCAAIFLWLRKIHELSYPVPWPDEGSFLWPTLAVRDRTSLFAPELFPTREVFWMPPGFMILEGFIFKLWAFSLGRARLLSALELLGAFACVASMLSRSRLRVVHALVLGIFLFSPIFQLAGNTARMEALVLLVSSSGFLLLHHKRWAGLGLLAFGPLVHPVGMLFFGVGCGYWFIARREGRVLARADRIVLACAAVAWAVYTVHVASHFGWFVSDMAGQLKFKTYVSLGHGGIRSRLFEPLVIVSFVGVAFALAVALRFGANTGAMAALGLSALLASTLTEGWLYDVYPAFGALLAALLTLETGEFLLDRSAPAQDALGRTMKLTLLSTAVLYVADTWMVLHPYLMRSVASATASSWSEDPSYFSPEEHRKVAEYLRRITPQSGRISVQFVPDADALLFENLRSSALGFVQQTFYETKPDVLIFHKSPWFPKSVFDLELVGFILRSGVTDPPEVWTELARGPSGSRWSVVRKLPGKIDWH